MRGNKLKRFFSKFLTLNLLIIFLAFWVFNHYIVNEMAEYLIEKKEEDLISQSQIVERKYQKFLSDGVLRYEDLTSELDAMERFLNTKIGFSTRSGGLFAASLNYSPERIEKYFTNEDIANVYEGNIVIKKSKTFSDKGENFLVLGYPLSFYEKTHFALIMDASFPEIEATISKINSISIYAVLFIALVIFLVNFYSIRRLSDSINKINKGINEITKGNYEETINLYKNDALGDLARSYNSMTKDLKKYEEMRKNFVSNLSHDMRTPLTLITGFIQGIKDGTIKEEERDKYLDIVLDESKRLIKMTNDVLDLSNIQAGGMKFNMEPFDLNGTVLNVLESLEQRIIEKEIDLQVSLQEGMFYAYGDELKIQRVVYNLVDNALKFSHQNGTIILKTYTKNELIFFEIINFGEIINMEELPLVFNRFTKLDQSRGKEKMGSGLGLSIAKEILKGHGQDIYVESSQEKGVVFTFSLSQCKKRLILEGE